MRHADRRFLGRVLLLMLLASAGLLAYEHIAQAKLLELSQRLQQLRQEQQKRQAEIAHLNAEKEALKVEIQQARAAAEKSRCDALVAQIDAEVIVTRAQCLKNQSDYAECNARNSEKASNGGFWGCVLGMGVAVVTGGAGLPLTAAGCAGGRAVGEASQVACGAPPTCTEQFNEIEVMVLANHGLSRRPVCQQLPMQPILR
jgi:hypothetical protein